jgi:Mg/Co/Ni transporter MgtE
VFTPVYVIAQCSKIETPRIRGSVFITPDDSLSEELINSVPMKRVNEILDSMDDERRTSRRQLDEYEAELIARGKALQAADEELNKARKQLNIYEAELIAGAKALEAVDSPPKDKGL